MCLLLLEIQKIEKLSNNRKEFIMVYPRYHPLSGPMKVGATVQESGNVIWVVKRTKVAPTAILFPEDG